MKKKRTTCADCPRWITYILEKNWKYCEWAYDSRMCMKHGKPDFTIPEIGTEMFEERYRSWKRLEYKNPNCMPGTINYDYSYLIYQNHLENELFLKNFGVIPIETGEAMVTGKDQHG